MSKELCIGAVDPGKTGALAWYFPGVPSVISAEDNPLVDGEFNAELFAARIEQMKPDLMIIERVHSMPGQGVASTFSFGKGYGAILGVIAALKVPSHLITPGKWKKHFSLSSDKEQSRSLALRLWPERAELFKLKRHEARAEACLLAKYGADVVMRGAP